MQRPHTDNEQHNGPGCAISWEVVMPTMQKAPRPAQGKGLALRRIHIEQKLCLEALHIFYLSVTSLFIWQKSPSCSCQASRPEQWQLPVCSSWGSCMAETGCQVFWGILTPQEIHYCMREQTVPLCVGAWRPFESWTEPAGRSLGLARNQKQYVRQRKHFQKIGNEQ